MQKCPKCGTILDDSKKQCYMCGTMLKEENSGSFAEALGLIDTPEETTNTNNKVTPAENEFSDNNINFFSEELDRLNSIKIKNPEQEQSKAKSTKQESKDTKKETKKEPKKNNKTKKKQEPPAENNLPKNGTFFSQNNPSYGNPTPSKNNQNKPKFQIKFNHIFNIACVIIFIVVVVMACKYFFQPKETKNNLGGLIFKVDDRFELSSSDGSNRYYKYGDNCSIRLMYGASSGGDDFIDNYLESQKEEFEKQENTSTMTEELLINGNSWKALSIINFVQIDDSSEYDPFLKYKYVSIFHNGNFYHTVFVNGDNDTTCREMYDEFTSTLTFE